MSLTAGSRLGWYEILSPLGAGGMGEVFRARDTKLEREVALKMLPPDFASDPVRLARFEREAKLLAALNHPSVAAIYGLEEADGRPFLVLELALGEDLQARIARGRVLPDEAVAIARQLAEALEAAHEKGIVHRDLKPANVMVGADGLVKVLDFGLAKAWAGDATGPASGSGAMSQSPTLAHGGSEAGLLLGTAAYMAPSGSRGPTRRSALPWPRRTKPPSKPVVAATGDVYYLARTRDGNEIRRTSLEGSPSTLVARDVLDPEFAISPDGRSLAFRVLEAGEGRLFSLTIAGGSPERLTDYSAFPAYSPDGTRLAFYYFDAGTRRWRIGIAPATGGPPETSLDAEPPNFNSRISFGEDGLYINTMAGDRANIWLQPTDGRLPKRLTDFQDQLVFEFALSPDGKSLAYCRGSRTRDALLVRGFR